jgi:hypothetical protein
MDRLRVLDCFSDFTLFLDLLVINLTFMNENKDDSGFHDIMGSSVLRYL